jgi:hypothetical protein
MAHGVGFPHGGVASNRNASLSSCCPAPCAQARGSIPSSTPRCPQTVGPSCGPSGRRHPTPTKASRSVRPQLRNRSGLTASTDAAGEGVRERLVLGTVCAGGNASRGFRLRTRTHRDAVCRASSLGEASPESDGSNHTGDSSPHPDGSNTNTNDLESQRRDTELKPVSHAVELCETRSVGVVGSLREALEKLQHELKELHSRSPLPYASGVVRAR